MGGCNEQAHLRTRRHNTVQSRFVGVSWTITHMSGPAPNPKALNESNINTNTSCLGRNFILLDYINRSADVYPYHGNYKSLENVKIVSAAITYDHYNGQRHILVINESLISGEKLTIVC